MKKVSGILFDFNGTMVIDDPFHKEAWNEFSKKYRGHALSVEEMKHILGDPNVVILKRFFPNASEEELTSYSLEKEAMYRELCRQNPSKYQLIPGLKNVLDECKKEQIPMLICSASIKDNIDFFIETFDLQQWFPTDLIVYDDGSYPNKKSMYIEGSHRIHIPIEECIIFEDSIAGVENALQLHPAKLIAIADQVKRQASHIYSKADIVMEDYTNFTIKNI